MSRTFGCLMLAVVAAFSLACQEEGVVQVHSLKFKGTRNIEESALRAVLATHVNSKLPWGKKAYFDRSRFEEDLKRIQTFYVDRGYPDARVTGFNVRLNKREDAVDITLTIAEGSPVRIAAVNLVGFEVLPPGNLDTLKKQLPLKIGQPRDRQLVLSAHETAVNALRDRGYPYSTVTVNEDGGQDGKSAALTFKAEPGPVAHFGPVTVTGNRHVSENVIRRGVEYNEGDLYRRSRVQETQRRLYATQLFQFVTVDPTGPGTSHTDAATDEAGTADRVRLSTADAQAPAEQPSDVPTSITVVEGKPERTTFGVGYGTEEKVRADAQYRRLNFFGGGRTADVHGRWSSLNRGLALNFNQPYVVAPQFSLGVLGQEWYTFTPAYRSVISGGKVTLTHRTSARTYWAVSMTSERDESSIEDAVLTNPALRNDLIALGLNPSTGRQSGTLNALGVDFQWSTAPNPLNATRGYQLTLHAEQAGRFLPGSFNYSSFSIDGRHYLPFGSRLVWANRAQVGNIAPANGDNDVPFGKRFFLGGSTSIRGWGIYEIGPVAGGLPVGGNSMVAFTSEMRARVQGKLGAVLFLDGGNVWADSFGMKLADLRYAVGPGLRYQTPIGPIRFDLGYQLNPEPDLLVNGAPQRRRWRVHFSVGQAF